MDCPDIDNLPGTMRVDDCGNPATRTTLIHRGVLVGDLDQEKGVWRRGDYRDLPYIRASNFIIREGQDDPSGWLSAPCVYVTEIAKGTWIPGSRRIKIMCGTSFKLEFGSPIARRPWTILEFDSLDVLSRIESVGRDFAIDPHVHWCVKRHQPVPISLGSPSLLLRPAP